MACDPRRAYPRRVARSVRGRRRGQQRQVRGGDPFNWRRGDEGRRRSPSGHPEVLHRPAPQTEEICGLESEAFQTLKYDSPGKACLEEEANNRPQPVWAEKVKIVTLEKSGDSANATIEPNAGTNARAQITLSRSDGAWIIDALR